MASIVSFCAGVSKDSAVRMGTGSPKDKPCENVVVVLMMAALVWIRRMTSSLG